MGQPSWIVLILLGTILGQVDKLFVLFKRQRTTSMLKGEWFAYHITKRGAGELLREGKWTFRKKVVNVEYLDTKKSYRGKVVFHWGNTCIDLTGKDFSEFVSIRLLPQRPPEDIVEGVWFGPDENGELRTDFWFLAQKQMAQDMAIGYIEEGRRRVLRLNK